MESLIDKRTENMENFSICRKLMKEPGRLYVESVSEAYKEYQNLYKSYKDLSDEADKKTIPLGRASITENTKE